MASGRSSEMILAGDIGGTNARLRLYDRAGKRILHEAVLPSASARSLIAILRQFLSARTGKVLSAALAIAGPVVAGVGDITNLKWKVDERKLSRELGIPQVSLLNDLAAGAIGCTRVSPSARVVISRGSAPKGGNMAVIAAGTGLGEALLIWDGQKYIPSATEGGHCDFAPNSDLELELLKYLRDRFAQGHVSFERVLSGPGLGNIYDFFVERHGGESLENAEKLANGDRNAQIAALGLAGKSRASVDAVDLFSRIYGAEAGNLALKGLALAGVFVLGKIATSLLPRRKGPFLRGMRSKGRMGDLLHAAPVTLVTDRLVGLTGAGYIAARLAAG
jgi:glucokinase